MEPGLEVWGVRGRQQSPCQAVEFGSRWQAWSAKQGARRPGGPPSALSALWSGLPQGQGPMWLSGDGTW